MRIGRRAATRWVSSLPPTSTIWAAPAASKWVRSALVTLCPPPGAAPGNLRRGRYHRDMDTAPLDRERPLPARSPLAPRRRGRRSPAVAGSSVAQAKSARSRRSRAGRTLAAERASHRRDDHARDPPRSGLPRRSRGDRYVETIGRRLVAVSTERVRIRVLPDPRPDHQRFRDARWIRGCAYRPVARGANRVRTRRRARARSRACHPAPSCAPARQAATAHLADHRGAGARDARSALQSASRAGGDRDDARPARSRRTLNYSRDFEREADRVGFSLLGDAGFDVNGMPAFFERLGKATRACTTTTRRPICAPIR